LLGIEIVEERCEESSGFWLENKHQEPNCSLKKLEVIGSILHE